MIHTERWQKPMGLRQMIQLWKERGNMSKTILPEFEAKARAINMEMDAWIAEHRRKGDFPADPLAGQQYYASLVAKALQETYEKAMNEEREACIEIVKQDRETFRRINEPNACKVLGNF